MSSVSQSDRRYDATRLQQLDGLPRAGHEENLQKTTGIKLVETCFDDNEAL